MHTFNYSIIMETINIIRIGPEALPQLQQIGRQTFFETFAEVNTEENMEQSFIQNV